MYNGKILIEADFIKHTHNYLYVNVLTYKGSVKHKLYGLLVIPQSYGSQLKGYCDNYNRRDTIHSSTIYKLDCAVIFK